VELDAAEPPFLDGSALPYVRMIREAGIVAQDSDARVVRIPAPLAFRDGDSEISALPSETLRVTFFFSSENPFLRTQAAGFVIDPETFAAEIAPARTFCFFEEIENLRRQGLIRGGSLSSAVVIGKKSIINESLRFPDEPVRHKILDFIGDLALLGFPVAGHFLAWRAGHRVNAAFGQFLRKELAL
jgi:UDP-3-O-acyl N-acetylglucosamine deacetylase